MEVYLDHHFESWPLHLPVVRAGGACYSQAFLFIIKKPKSRVNMQIQYTQGNQQVEPPNNVSLEDQLGDFYRFNMFIFRGVGYPSGFNQWIQAAGSAGLGCNDDKGSVGYKIASPTKNMIPRCSHVWNI